MKRRKNPHWSTMHLYEKKKKCFLLDNADTFKLSTWISDSTKPSFLQVIKNSGVCRWAHEHKHACVCSSDILFGIGRFRNKVQDSGNSSSESTTLRQWALLGKSASLVMHCWPCPKVHRSFSPMLLSIQVSLENYYLSYQIQQSTLLTKHLDSF